MATHHDELTAEELGRQHPLDRSWDTAQRALGDEDFRDYLESSVERVKSSSAMPVTRDEFLAQTEPSTPQ
jgi:hypothetical protein